MGRATAPDPMTSAEALLRTAAAAGIDVCFANPGTTEMPLVAALDAVPDVRAVLGLFEGVCTGAADGYGRMTGRPALTLLHLGPGFANGIANLHNAQRARSPVVNLIGDQTSWHLEHDAPLTSDIESLARPVSGWLRTSSSAQAVPGDFAEAVAAATGPPGSVASLILPADHQQGAVDGPHAVAPATTRPRTSERSVASAAEALGGSVRGPTSGVTLLLGGSALSVRGQRAAARIRRARGARLLAETFPARWERGGDLPTIDRLPYFPQQVQELLATDSHVIVAGAREPIAFFGYEGVPSQLVEAERLLELASPGEDAEAALEELADRLGPDARANADEAPADGASTTGAPEGALDPAKVGAVLAAGLPENAIVMDEAATTGLPFYFAAAPRHTLLSLTGGAIGQGLPCATGAAIACPDRKVIAFQADGSGMYTLQSLWTQARESLDIVTLLCSNRAYRILQVELGRAGVWAPGPVARDLTELDRPELDWVALARGCGVPGERVETAEALARALTRALAEPGPHLIEMML